MVSLFAQLLSTSANITACRDETFKFLVGPETKTFIATILDHKTIGRDRHLGEAVVDVRL